MADKVLNTRVQQKHDIEANWLKATNFIPKIGEVIVYDPDETHEIARIKIGDGERTVGQLPFISEQADWNVNDENSAAYVKNRTHYVEISDSITFNPNNETLYDVSGTYNIEASQQYEVIWDGEIYNCTAVIPSNINMVALGNSALYNYNPYKEDTGEPFGMIFGSRSIMIAAEDASIPHTFSITGVTQLQEVVHQLDEKFIPDSIARKKDILTPVQSDWSTNDESDLSYVKNRTHYEVEKTIELLPNTVAAPGAPSAIADFTEDWNNDQFVALGNSKIYTTFDGKTYTYDSGLDYLETGGSSTTIMLGGNPYLFDNYLTDNGLPFFVGLMLIGKRFIAKWPEDGNEHTFSIKYGSGEYDVHQLDPKFIPTASEEQLIQLLIDIDALPAMTDSNGAIFTHKDSILLI